MPRLFNIKKTTGYLLEEGPDFVGRDLVYCERRTKFVYYFPQGHNLILQPQLVQVVSDLVNKVIMLLVVHTYC